MALDFHWMAVGITRRPSQLANTYQFRPQHSLPIARKDGSQRQEIIQLRGTLEYATEIVTPVCTRCYESDLLSDITYQNEDYGYVIDQKPAEIRSDCVSSPGGGR